MNLLSSCILVLYALVEVQGEDLFTSLSYLRCLLQTETAALSAIRSHLEAEDARLHTLLKIHRNFIQRRQASAETQHPVKRYDIIAGYIRAIRQNLSLTVRNHKSNVHALMSATKQLTWPTRDDLEGSAVGLCRLVDTYSVALGRMILLRSRAVPESTTSDYVEVASHCLENSYAEVAANWAKLAISEGQRSLWKAASEILSRAQFSLGNNEKALDVVKGNLALPPESPGLMLLKPKYETALNEKRTYVKPQNDDAASFQSLCVSGGDVHAQIDVSKSLRCGMATACGNPLLLLQPIKMEVVFPDPKIILFHDFLSREECKALRRVAGPRLMRSRVNIDSTNQYVSFRISKATFLRDDRFSILPPISHRISLVTGLSTESAAPYQVANYGVGGHYVPHYDFILKGQPKFRDEGLDAQRLATFLIYLSDTVAGGATAFVGPRVAVKPRMGMAVFWFNLVRPKNASGADEFNWNEARKGDARTMHGSCPVLQGSKWIATKWLREKGQGIVNYDLY